MLEGRLDRQVARVRGAQPVPLRLRLWNGRTYDLGPNPTVTVTLPRPSALRYFLSPDLMTLGEAYVEGRIDVEGSLRDIFEVGELFARTAAKPSRFRGLKKMARHTRSLDRRAIRYHYDVSNDFYRLFLDENMVYSCAYFKRPTDSLAAAQEQKLDHILTKLQVKPGERLLDIGCGWGALVIRAAKKYGAQAVGVTLSDNQFALASERVKREGLEGQVEIRLQDYRDVPEEGGYDKISSVGMFEHVGLRNLEAYFAKIRRLLKDGGLVLNHGITSVDPDSRGVGLGAGEFIEKYVFPHGELPHISLVLQKMQAAGLDAVDVESLRQHYALTTGLWAQNLERNKDEAIRLAGDKRYRIWSVYLQGCSFGFREGWMTIYQVLAAKQGPKWMNPLPLTRDYMYSGRP
ncbi:MAG: cyclopropane-fatty-acyl-phospholipid synthase family protein [Burkholderiales bacterium]|nr:cyclopropane-fatty-acyl-phospholipid synthase family protein [Burkholderiales bacterium]